MIIYRQIAIVRFSRIFLLCGTYNTQNALDTLVQLNPVMEWLCAVQFQVAYRTPSPPNYQRQYLGEEECRRVFSVTRHRLLLPFIDYLPSQNDSRAERVHEYRIVIIHPDDHFITCRYVSLGGGYENILITVRY